MSNREIKFRAWDSINSKWLLGYDYPNLGGFSMMGEVMAFGEWQHVLASFKIEDWDKIILMQFTGLKDKNGKEIYEGDVIRITAGHPTWTKSNFKVVFFEGAFSLCCMDGMSGRDKPCSFINYSDLCVENGYNEDLSSYVEVIGNIYENPELLQP